MKTIEKEKDTPIIHSDLSEFYFAGIKPKSIHKIGIEYERLPVNLKGENITFFQKNGIRDLLQEIKKNGNWKGIKDESNLIGLKDERGTITLEPGCQFELSLFPKKNIYEIETIINEINLEIKNTLQTMEINLLDYAIQPLKTNESITIIPKRRYHSMAKYFHEEYAPVMMRETAGIQASYDYASQEDAIKKLKLTLMMSPLMTAMFANSPIRCGKDTGYKTFRGFAWCHTDINRCGLIQEKLFQNDNYTFNDYIENLLKIPMIFIMRGNKIIEINGKINFKTFIQKGFEGFFATLEDYKLHANLFFPDVRLNNYIEIRNHDTQKGKLKYAIPSIYKGILSSKTAQEGVFELFKGLKYKDFFNARIDVTKLALNAQLGKYKISDYAKNLIKIAKKSLKDNNDKDIQYIKEIENLTFDNICPADIILKYWYKEWDKSIYKLCEYSIS